MTNSISPSKLTLETSAYSLPFKGNHKKLNDNLTKEIEEYCSNTAQHFWHYMEEKGNKELLPVCTACFKAYYNKSKSNKNSILSENMNGMVAILRQEVTQQSKLDCTNWLKQYKVDAE